MAINQELISKEYHDNASLQNFNSVDDMAKSFIELKSMQGSSLRIPSENASDEDVTAFNSTMGSKLPNWMLKPDFENAEQSGDFWSKMGVPSESKDYKIPDVTVPDGKKLSPERQEYFRGVAKDANLTPAQFKSMMTKILTTEVEAIEAASVAKSDATKVIKEHWGKAYDERLAMAVKTAEATGAPQVVLDSVKEGTAGVETMDWMYKVGTALGGEGRELMQNAEDRTGKTGTLAPAEALRQLDEINKNPEHAYYTARGEEKKRATEAYVALMKQAYPNAQTEMQRA